jgi:LysM repeat protein/predicted Zn-dependent peptidase
VRLDRLLFATSLLVAFPSWALGGELDAKGQVEPSRTSTPALGEDAILPAETPPEAATSARASTDPGLQELTLPSGLRIVLDPEPFGSEVTVCTSVDAGARRDPLGQPGAQRLLAEMLALGGFPTAGQDRAELLRTRGLRSTLALARDLVTYCTTAPAVELPLALWVNAGRFTRLLLTSKEREAAIERLAQAVEARDGDVVSGRAPVRLRQMVLLGTPAYAHPDLPDVHDLEAIALADLRRLHDEAYVAHTSALTISGSFEPEVAQRLLPAALGMVKSGLVETGPLSQEDSPELVPQSTPRFSMAEDASIKSPSAFYGWLLPADAPRAELELALWTLAGPGRLGQKLVGPGKAARELAIDIEPGRGPGLLSMRVAGTGPQSLGTIEKVLEQELRALSSVAPSSDELSEVERRLSERRQGLLHGASSRARALSEGLVRGMTAGQVLAVVEGGSSGHPEPEAIRQAAARFLVAARQSTIEIYPKGWQDPWQVPMPVYHIVSGGETLTSIAKQHRTTVQAIVKMNGIREKSPIYPGDKLKVPRGKHHEEAKLRTHVVRRGDTLSALGLRYGVSARAIAEQNGMSVKQAISVGETLRIPNRDKGGAGSDAGSGSGSSKDKAGKSDAPLGKAPQNAHVVQPGETLGGIAIKLGVRLAALATANGLTTKSMVRVGQTLIIPTDAAARRADVPKTKSYAVKNGDTLSGVAKQHGATVTELEKLNGISRKATLRVGQTLQIPAK